MPKSSRRKDSKGRVLKTGESERKGSYVGYQYRFTDPITQKRVTIYAKTFITNIVNGGVSVKSAQYPSWLFKRSGNSGCICGF